MNHSASEPWRLYSESRRWVYLCVIFLVTLSAYVDRNVVAIILEPIKAEFRVSDAMLGLLTGGAFAIFYATLGMPIARWADRGDRRLVLALSIAVWSLMTMLCGLSQSFWQLAAARIGVGAGEAGAAPPAQSLLVDYFPPTQRARAFGVYLTASTAASLLTMTLGGQVVQAFGWRALLLLAGAPGLMLALLARMILKEPRCILGVAQSGRGEALRPALRALLGKRSYRNILVGFTLYCLIAYGVLVFLVSFTVRVHGFSVAKAGLIVGLVTGAGSLLGNLVGGILTDRLAARDVGRLTLIPGWGLTAACPVMLGVFATPAVPWMLALLFAGFCMILAVAPAFYAALHAVRGSARRATALAIALFCGNVIGFSLGPLITGSLSDWFSRSMGPAQGLRLSLLFMMTLFMPSGFFLLRATKSLRVELEA